jgi:hypothetical protein
VQQSQVLYPESFPVQAGRDSPILTNFLGQHSPILLHS